jgi:hypothetical protein
MIRDGLCSSRISTGLSVLMLDLALIGSVAGQEAARQQTDLAGLVRLLDAYRWAFHAGGALNRHWLAVVATKIEPQNSKGYRRTPVTFANGGDSAHWSTIDRLIDNWAKNKHWPIEARVKELGWIHPYEDGNGRLMWIVRTRLTNTWASPEPLPNYFGE